ncbi:MAG: TonB-dependent receptor [Bacteroidetes bacterium]|uniref:TonB-dependent receptor n=1 Tax=Candidatus Cryptobacteroides excrementavium TaxID=2840759 RepID=A0A9D9J1K7_9BACT|nr:TonB-dependent receptor [Candidatus Cryptobacteroides excrementavium]
MKQTFKGLLLSLAAIFVAGGVASAQVTTSGMGGRIADEDGEPLAGAAVIAVHTPSGTQYSAVSNEEGRYVITGMRAGGPYSVEISYIGMADLEYNGVTLALGETYELDAEMKVSNELDAVVLVAESAFDSHKTGAGTNFTLGAIQNTPTVDRSIYDIVQYNPQASMTMEGGISFAGTNNRYNSFQVDGAVANDAFGLSSQGYNGGQAGVSPVSLDALDAIQVVVAPFDVRQSGFTGGAINSVTKSGTNTITGSAYTYFNNQDFIGVTPGKISGDQKRSRYAQQTSQVYGFTIGAPIIKDKLFIFASAEYTRNSTPNVYTPANGSYDGVQLTEDVILKDGTNLGNVFNSAIADAVIKHYEETYGVSNTGESYSQHQVIDQSINAMLRLDWNIKDNHKFMFRYQILDGYSDKYGSDASTYVFNNSSYRQSNQTHTLVAELNSRISDMVSNEFRATATIVRDKRSVPYKGANVYIGRHEPVMLNIGTDYSSGANEVHSDVYTISDNVSIFKGNHNITVGTHNEFFRFYNVFIQAAYGSYGFNTINGFLNDEFGTDGYGYAYNYADPSVTGGKSIWGGTPRAAQFGFYAQDEWKPSTRFTLTYGLRLDIPTMLNKPTENRDFNASEIAKFNDQYVGTVPKASVLFSPRIGFRWYMDKDKKSLLRGGAGIFTGRVPFVWIENAYNNTGMEYKSVSVYDQGEMAQLPFTSNPYQDIVNNPDLDFITPGSSNTINTVSENFKYPQTFRLNLGYEQVFSHGWKFTFDALYSKGINNVYFKNLAVKETDNVVYAVGPDVPGKTATLYDYVDADSPYTTVVGLENTNKGFSYSLSAQLEKSFDFGLNLMASYTFGHSYSVNDGLSSTAMSSWQYNYAVNSNDPELSFSSFDRPHKVMAVVSYTTPKYAAGRLQTSVSLTYTGNSGRRYSYTLSDGGVDFNQDRANYNSLMYIPTASEVQQMKWADAADAALFEDFIKGDKYLSKHRGEWSERYGAITPFENHFDLHIAQDFYYDRKSGRKIQFVVDFMNIGNMFNSEWGVFRYFSRPYRQALIVNATNQDGTTGNMIPEYKYTEPVDLSASLNDVLSRWRCQIGLRVTF